MPKVTTAHIIAPLFTESDKVRFWSYVEVSPLLLTIPPYGNCWEWTGGNSKGYGQFHIRHESETKAVYAHRYTFLTLIGDISEPLELDHICRNKACVNPEHLQLVTSKQNTRRGYGPAALRLRGLNIDRTIRATRWQELPYPLNVPYSRRVFASYLDGDTSKLTTCNNGHQLNPDNVRINCRGVVVCRMCDILSHREFRREKRTMRDSSKSLSSAMESVYCVPI